jgi:AcrR family transcriptional regulator
VTQRTSPRRRPLSEDRIVSAALRIVDRSGLEALTMRAVGGALGYEAMSLYKHVANKQQLLQLVIERVAAELEGPVSSASWEERLRHIAREWRRVALAHPHVFPLLATAPPPSPASLLPIIDATIGALLEGTNDDEAAIGYFWTFVAYTSGALIAECNATIDAGPEPRPDPAALDPDSLPHLAALGPAVSACDFPVEYERGIETLIRSTKASGRP